jgi:hypothetical protein
VLGELIGRPDTPLAPHVKAHVLRQLDVAQERFAAIAPAGRVGRTDCWYEDEWTAWCEGHLRGKIGSLTEVDRGGDPDDLVDAAEAARMLRYSSRYVIHANRRLGSPTAATRSESRPATSVAPAPSGDLLARAREGDLLARARELDAEHRAATGKPISRDSLRDQMRIGRDRAGAIIALVRAEVAADGESGQLPAA